jgi:hypothetical protein
LSIAELIHKFRPKTGKANRRQELRGTDLNVGLFQREGFTNPILVKDKDGLGLTVPNVGVQDIQANAFPPVIDPNLSQKF